MCFEGKSGLMNRIPKECFRDASPEKAYNRSNGEIWLHNGSKIEGYTGQEPGRLRGPNFDRAWSDELAAWQYPEETWDMLQFGLRVGERPRNIITTTPQSIPLIRQLLADPDTHLTRGSSYDNRANLAPDFFAKLAKYEGTALGRQEIYGDVLDLSESAILPRSWWKVWTAIKLPKLKGVVLSFDTASKIKTHNDFCAMTAWGIFHPPIPGSGQLGPDGKFIPGTEALDEEKHALILLRAWRKRLRLPDLLDLAKQEVTDAEGRYDGPPEHIIIEDTSAGIGLIQFLEDAGVSVFPYNPGREDKVMRASLASVYLKSGLVYVLGLRDGYGGRRADKVVPMAEMVIAECEAFPPAKANSTMRHVPDGADESTDGHDDLVDTCAQVWTYMGDAGYLIADTALPPEIEYGDAAPKRAFYG